MSLTLKDQEEKKVPLIKSVSPKSASPGDSVTLVGENF
jgi:hypothetical protein